MNRIELALVYYFHTLKGVGNRTLWKIKNELGGFQSCFEADSKLLKRSSLSESIVNTIIASRSSADPLALLEQLLANDTKISCVEDDDYPQLLKNIYDPPYIFYYHGDIQILKEFCIAVVGSRQATHYGMVQARRFGKELVQEGIVVVSGMARGVDTEAHQGALEAGGKTVAVLGSGLDVVYPPENRKLYNRICQSGLVLSEFPPHTHPEPGNFPARNRTISGLCRGIVVVEAEKRSGALITADFALEQGRDVFAIPGSINSKKSEGTNNLIKQGAYLLSGIEDILTEYGMKEENKLPQVRQGLLFDLDDEESLVLKFLEDQSLHIDSLMAKTGMSHGILSTIVLKMELKGIIRALPGNYYVKI